MEDYRTIVRFIPAFLLGSAFSVVPLVSYEYALKTHMGLTQATVETYVATTGTTFSSSESDAVLQGSFDEDAGYRSVNHFFDPIYERGLTVGISWPSSKQWAQDTEAQANFCIQRLCSDTVSYQDRYFSSPQDYSWDRSVYEYAYGDKLRGLQGVGHILHLLQDAAVPAHVRNDQHLNLDGYGDFDPYEQFGQKFDQQNIASLGHITIPQRSSINAYFDAVASFTNGHFLSKDAMFSSYVYPELGQLNLRFDKFVYDPALGHAVGLSLKGPDIFGRLNENEIVLYDSKEDNGSKVFNDYWSLLSKEAIKNGVGVMDLFFKAVADEKKTHVLQKKNTSQQERDAAALVAKGFAIAKKLYGSSLDANDVSDLMNTGQSAAAINALQQDPPTQEKTSTAQTPSPVTPAPKPASKPRVVITSQPAAPVQQIHASSTIQVSPRNEYPNYPGYAGGGGGSSSNSGSTPPADSGTPTPPVVTVAAPVVVSPSSSSRIGTTTLTLSGTAEANKNITISYFALGATTTATTTAAVDGSWTFTPLAVDEGTTLFSVVADNGAGVSSATTTYSVITDITAPSITSFGIFECAHSLLLSSCGAGSAVTLTYTLPSDLSYYNIIVDSAVVGTSSAATTTLSSLAVGSHTFALAAYDQAGNSSTSTPITVQSLESPVVINEVAWAGTAAHASDQWIELFNRSSSTIDLSSVSLLSLDGSLVAPLSGTLAAGAYYLIEQSETATDIASNLLLSGLALTTTPVQLSLAYTPASLSTTTLDSTPAASACSGSWCGGTSDSAHRSMERKQAATVGTLASNWISNNTFTKNGLDANCTAINGTPGGQNSESLSSIGFYCGPYTESFVEGNYYQPTSGSCQFLSPGLVGLVRYGLTYVGTVGAATEYNAFSMGASQNSSQFGDPVSALSQVEGQDLFAAIVLLPTGPDATLYLNQFKSYFTDGSAPPPSLNYGIIRFKWGTGI